MISFLKKKYLLLLVFVASFSIYYPSLFVFYTNDDFFLLKISQAKSFGQFINFFNIVKGPDGLGMYRPITIQLYYFMAWKLFNLQPLGLHIISFLVLFGVIYLIYRLVIELVGNEKIALISSFLYATSATHFGHLYYLATFQELGMTFFVLLSCLSFIRRKNISSLIFFILAVMSKETGVVTPLILVLIYLFQRSQGYKVGTFKKLLIRLTPFMFILAVYMAFRVFSYGFASGDSYVWDISFHKFANTQTWYLVWSLNLPETFLDFVGSGLKINSNLLLYWSKEAVPVLILFFIQGIFVTSMLIRILFEKSDKLKFESNRISAFSIFWFTISLLPVAFLPLHKFTFYLTLPLVGIVLNLAYLLVKSKLGNFYIFIFLFLWAFLSTLTVKYTVMTNWITQGELISEKVYKYFNQHKSEASFEGYFVDTGEDKDLPWTPTSVIKTALSDKNFFKVFYPVLEPKITYQNGVGVKIRSRQFLAY